MATSRTGTAQYKHWRRRVLAEARDSGLTHCPSCGVLLNYAKGLEPNSAEADHIVAWRWGGRNTSRNGQVLCRRCNQSKGDGKRARSAPPRTTTTDFAW